MTRQMVRPIGIGYFIGSALIRGRRGHAPRYAADKGLLLRDTEPDIAADGAAFASCLNGRGRGPLRSSCEKASRCLVQHGGGEPSQ